jgi:hypothetical protein
MNQNINAKSQFSLVGQRVQKLSDATGELVAKASSAFVPQRTYAFLTV